jgi:hypothetical protein
MSLLYNYKQIFFTRKNPTGNKNRQIRTMQKKAF